MHDCRARPTLAAMRSMAAILLGLAVLTAGGCGGVPVTMLHGYPVDEHDACVDHDCRKLLARAASWLASAEPGHPPVVAFEGHRIKIFDQTGDRILLTRSGGGLELVIVLRLADGSSRGRYVWCGAGVDPDICGDLSAHEVNRLYRGT